MSQSTQSFETSSCKGSPLPDTQCRLDQWTDTTEERISSSFNQSASHSSGFPKSLSSLTTADELEQHPYRDPDRLRTAYEQAGTIVGTAAHFDVSETAVRMWLIHYGIYDPETQGLTQVANRLEELSPEDLGLPPLGERR
jgi:hypothetical protein